MASSGLVGLDKANAAVRRLPLYAKEEVQIVATVTAAKVAALASSHAPRSADGSHGKPSGFLAAAIHWRAQGRGAIVGILFAAFYWKFLEYGTKVLSARPFIRPAADELRSDHHTRLIAGLKRAADRIRHG